LSGGGHQLDGRGGGGALKRPTVFETPNAGGRGNDVGFHSFTSEGAEFLTALKRPTCADRLPARVVREVLLSHCGFETKKGSLGLRTTTIKPTKSDVTNGWREGSTKAERRTPYRKDLSLTT